MRRAGQAAGDLVAFGVRDLWYILRWPAVGRLGRVDPARYRDPRPRTSPDVVLLPGVYETWHFLRPVADHLFAHGHRVHTVASMGNNHGPVEVMAARVSEYLDAHDLHDVVLVAHSKGGLIGKYLIGHTSAGRRVRAMVAVNSPFGGSHLAHVIPMRAVRHFHHRHPTLSLLEDSDEVNHRITSIVSRYDPLVRDHEATPGATNLPLDAIGHFIVMTDPRVLAAVLAVVEGRDPSTTIPWDAGSAGSAVEGTD